MKRCGARDSSEECPPNVSMTPAIVSLVPEASRWMFGSGRVSSFPWNAIAARWNQSLPSLFDMGAAALMTSRRITP
jgi:hypothetical protein